MYRDWKSKIKKTGFSFAVQVCLSNGKDQTVLYQKFFYNNKASLLYIINSINKALFCYILGVLVWSTSKRGLLICNKNVFLCSIKLYLYSMKNISHLRKYIYTQ